MKNAMVFLLLLSLVIACKEGTKSNSPLQAKNIKSSISKNTKYNKKNILCIEMKPVFTNRGFLTLFPANLVVNSRGEIFFVSYSMRMNDPQLWFSDINKFSANGKMLKQKKFDFNITYLARSKKAGLAIESTSYREEQFLQEYDYDIIPSSKKIFQDKNKKEFSFRDVAENIFLLNPYKHEMFMHNNIFESVNIGSVGFKPVMIGMDIYGNKYFANTTIESDRVVALKNWHIPVSYIVVQGVQKNQKWKIDFPNSYGAGNNDVNALGGRSFFITPSGIIYVMTVTLTHLHIDKYVPEFVAKNAGGAENAYY